MSRDAKQLSDLPGAAKRDLGNRLSHVAIEVHVTSGVDCIGVVV